MENELSVLIVEDEALIAETIRLILENFGYHIADVCYEYDQAVAAIHSNNYDLLLTDINLGDGITHRSGFCLVTALHTLRKVPFIFLTAFDDRETIRRAASLMPSAYLTKPINAANLYASIQVAVENFRSNQPVTRIENLPSPDFIYTKVGKRLIKLFWSDIYLLESVKNYVLLRTVEYPYGVPIRSSLLSVMQAMIPASQRDRFVRINRSMVVDHSIIRSYNNTEVETLVGLFKYTLQPTKSTPGKPDEV